MGTPSNQWTEAEDRAIRDVPMREAMARLPHRTFCAIKFRKKSFPSLRPKTWRWTKAEDRRLRKYADQPLTFLVRKLKNRSLGAIEGRRQHLGLRRNLVSWKTTDVAKLAKSFLSATWPELKAAFPTHSKGSIMEKARELGLVKPRRKGVAVNDLREEVRVRAREDGISLSKLGIEIGCGGYFKQMKDKSVDINKIVKAVEFFGGRLVIDWQDE